MVLNEKECKRLIIYFIYDKQGIVDDYIIYMLEALKQNSLEIAVVCNGLLTKESREKLNGVTDNIIVRENKGLDVWAYKTVLDSYGWKQLEEFDEVIMMNFTIMGPVYPLSEMFSTMSAKDVDFWGITEFHEFKEGDPFGTIEVGYIPEHIQSHFIAVRSSMLKSSEFQDYWDNMGEIRDYRDAVGKHEAMFTKRFSDKGFTWDVYADMGEGYNNHPILCATKEMLEQKRCPIFKRRSFMQDYDNIINDTVGQSAIEAYKFIEENTDYNVDMIWENILRLENQADIKRNMQLNYILSTTNSKINKEALSNKKIALIIHCYFEDLLSYCVDYISNIPENADVYVTVPSEKMKTLAEQEFSRLNNQVEIIQIQNRGRDVSALLVATKSFIMNYDYACFMHDKKVMQLKPETIGYGFSYKCFENLLASKEFVENVIDTFDKNPRLGMLMPPPPNHGDYYITLAWEWGENYKNTKKLAEKLGITVPICEEKEPIAPLGTMFWFRPKAMKLLFDQNWQYEDFPKEPNRTDGTLLHAVERIYSYTVQQEGYYPAWVFSDKGASIEITNLNHMVRGLNSVIFNEGSGAGKYPEVRDRLKIQCSQWSEMRGRFGGNTALDRATLYVNNGAGYSAELSSTEANTSKEAAKCDIEFSGLEKYGEIKEFRLDPGEASGVTLFDDVKIELLTSTHDMLTFSIRDAITNGIKIKNRMVFISVDPQLVFTLNNPVIASKLRITGTTIANVGNEDAKVIYRRTASVGQRVRNFSKRVIRKVKGR